jgi:hypothetical protein
MIIYKAFDHLHKIIPNFAPNKKMIISISCYLFFLLPNLLLNAPNLVLAVYEYQVVGQLFCNGSPWQNELVKLYDEDLITFDDLMGENRTDNNGHFQIRGSETDPFFEDSQFQPTPFLVTQDKCVSFYF